MNIKQDIDPQNDKGEYHGYQEWYDDYGTNLVFRGNFKNGLYKDYYEWHDSDVKGTNFFIR